MKKVYIKVTLDEMEQIVAMADTVEGLAKIVGVKPASISSCMSRARRHGYQSQYKVVEIDDD